MGLLRREQVVGMNQHYQRYSLDYFLDAQQRIGINNIELWCGAQHFWLDDQHYDDVCVLKKKLRSRGLQVVSLTCPSLRYAYQYAPFSSQASKACLGYFSKGIALAEELDCKIMTVNSGWGCIDRDREDAWKYSRDLLIALADEAERCGVILVMESLRKDESNLVCGVESAKRMWKEVNHASFKVMVDTIAMGAAGETLGQWFQVFGADLVHMHFLDGKPYTHNIWGDGNYPLEEMLMQLHYYGYNGYLVQEIADERYFNNPAGADEQNYRVLSQFFS